MSRSSASAAQKKAVADLDDCWLRWW